MQTINSYINDFLPDDEGIRMCETIICEDGFKISVQASVHHYCTPNTSYAAAYEKVECGFPSAVPIGIEEYADKPKDLLNSVYAYVPVALVEALLASHGGRVA